MVLGAAAGPSSPQTHLSTLGVGVGGVTQLEETFLRTFSLRDGLPPRTEDIRKGQYEASDTRPFFLDKERFREGDLAHRPKHTKGEGLSHHLARIPQFIDRSTEAPRRVCEVVWKDLSFGIKHIRIDISLAVQSQADGLASLNFSSSLGKWGDVHHSRLPVSLLWQNLSSLFQAGFRLHRSGEGQGQGSERVHRAQCKGLSVTTVMGETSGVGTEGDGTAERPPRPPGCLPQLYSSRLLQC